MHNYRTAKYCCVLWPIEVHILEMLIYMLICLTLQLGYSWILFKHFVYNNLFHSLLAFMGIGWICLLPDYIAIILTQYLFLMDDQITMFDLWFKFVSEPSKQCVQF